ncbi:hypothetical protein IFM89_014871 [Coptis chinensis]|uniref:R13L1/DRL21-like LRR repeat region domain-containing protein n=1 Tax=Coptis chinensis TaxID=261450 RepID=A0A835IA62_9MAGN|nr:hypothetical protein IFM89_014871 [Coptis chinensis]
MAGDGEYKWLRRSIRGAVKRSKSAKIQADEMRSRGEGHRLIPIGTQIIPVSSGSKDLESESDEVVDTENSEDMEDEIQFEDEHPEQEVINYEAQDMAGLEEDSDGFEAQPIPLAMDDSTVIRKIQNKESIESELGGETQANMEGSSNKQDYNKKESEDNTNSEVAIQGLENFSVYLAKKLRTFLTPAGLAHCTIPIELYHQLTCLRTLDLSGCEDMSIDNIPNEVGRLMHLRYLNLSNTKLSELPDTLCNLYNLQTLQLMRCTNLQKLPNGISKLYNLRHLEIFGTDALEYLPHGIGRLGFLRTLSKFIVDGGSKGCKMGELKHLNFLQGHLRIEGLERLGGMNEAAEAELEKKKDLHGLTLIFGEHTNGSDAEKMEGVLKNLQPDENLELLAIVGYPGLQFPDWITRLSNLVNLTIYSCKNLRVLPDLSKLKSLETLYLWGLEKLEECEEMVPSNNQGEGDIQLPRLCSVVIENCPKLKVVPHYIMFSHTLKGLTIQNCSEQYRTVQPWLPPLLEYLELFGDVGDYKILLTYSFQSHFHWLANAPTIAAVTQISNLFGSGLHRIRHSPRASPNSHQFKASNFTIVKPFDFGLEELKHLAMLQVLWIQDCPFLKKRFGEGKDWSILSHVPKITIHGQEITRRN